MGALPAISRRDVNAMPAAKLFAPNVGPPAQILSRLYPSILGTEIRFEFSATLIVDTRSRLLSLVWATGCPPLVDSSLYFLPLLFLLFFFFFLSPPLSRYFNVKRKPSTKRKIFLFFKYVYRAVWSSKREFTREPRWKYLFLFSIRRRQPLEPFTRRLFNII